MWRRWRRLRWWLLGGLGLLVVLAVGGPFVYIHLIEGPAPARLTLPNGRSGRGTSGSSASAAGTWNVDSGSVVGYRVQEVLIGQQSTAVGRTSEVWGSLLISGNSVTKGTFAVNMANVTSDQSQRNAQFDGRIMDVSAYPTARFALTSPIELGRIPASGAQESYSARGELTMHGVTRAVRFIVSAEHTGAAIYVLADIPIVFADWGIANPSIGGFVTTQNSGTLEVLLHLTRGAGNPAYSAPSSNSGANGGGGPVTVPSTTVPPLTVPGS